MWVLAAKPSLFTSQIDNFSETCVYPVLLTSATSEERIRDLELAVGDDQDGDHEGEDARGNGRKERSSKRDPHAMLLRIERVIPPNATATLYQSVVFRLLEMQLSIDTGTLAVLLTDLYDDFVPPSTDELIVERCPDKWLRDLKASMAAPLADSIDIPLVKKRVLSQKLNIGNLTMHPMKLILSFAPTKSPKRTKQQKSVRLARHFKHALSLIALDAMPVKIQGFSCEEVCESMDSLSAFILDKYRLIR